MKINDVENDLEMMTNTMNWPNFPVLPVKRYTKESCMPEAGIMVPDLPTVFVVNMWDLKSGVLKDQLKDVPKKEYATYQELIADGWVVD